jgi:hypothetical protein
MAKKFLNRSANLNLTCPKCGHKFQKTLGQLESDDKWPCPGSCGVTFDRSSFAQEIAAIEKKIEDFGRDISRAFKKK